MERIKQLINLWPSAEIFGDEIGLKWRSHARVMRWRGRIPRKYWPSVIAAARKRGFKGVDKPFLEEAHDGLCMHGHRRVKRAA